MTRKALREKIGNKALRMKKRGIHKPFFLIMRQLFWLLKERG